MGPSSPEGPVKGGWRMYAVGVCWKRGEWIFSIYIREGDAYPMLKVKRVRGGEGAAPRAAPIPKPSFVEAVKVV